MSDEKIEALAWTVIVFCFLFNGFLVFNGCAPKGAYWNAEKVDMKGPCFVFGGVEKGRKGKEKCFIPYPSNSRITCNRHEGHFGRHHLHIYKDCLKIWR